MTYEPHPRMDPDPLWAEWDDVWPVEPEPGCLAACFADVNPTDSEAEVAGLSHAYLSVTANEGIVTFQGLVVFGTALAGLSVWLVFHIVQTQSLSLIVALVPPVCLTCYCWGYVLLKYRLRRLLIEIVRFSCARLPGHLVRIVNTALWNLLGTPAWFLSKFVVIRKPGYQRSQERLGTRERLCSVCKTTVAGSQLLTGSSAPFCLTRSNERWHHHPVELLQQCAQHCHLCSLLCLSLGIRASEGTIPTMPHHGREKPGEGASGRVLESKSILRVRIWQRREWRTGMAVLRMRLEGTGAEKACPLVLEVGEFEDAVSEGLLEGCSTWSVAKRWIEICSCSHKLCQNESLQAMGGPSVFVPSRLIEIAEDEGRQCGIDEKNGGVSVKLVEGFSGLDRTAGYTAFGHEWGRHNAEAGQDPTVDTSRLRDGIPFEQLPEELQLAVSITRRLGFQHLWVDSVCVTGEPSKHSAAAHARVFSHAVCTISTAQSSSSLRRNLPRYDDCPLVFKTSSGDEKASCVIARTTDTAEIDSTAAFDTVFEQSVDNHPPNRRPRPSQERLLSRRLLFVCDGEPVFFECNTLRASSRHPRGVPYLPPSDSGRQLHPQSIRTRTKARNPFTYTYQTRKKVVDAERGAWKFETLVVPTPKLPREPTVSEQVERLQGVNAWRRHRGLLERLLRHGVDGVREPKQEHNRLWAEKMALNKAWFDLVAAFNALEPQSGVPSTKPMELIVAAVEEVHTSRGLHTEYFQGIWLGLLPLNLLWFTGRELTHRSTGGTRPRPASPSWSWIGINGPISHALADTPMSLEPAQKSARKVRGQSLRHVLADTRSNSSDEMWQALRVIPLVSEIAVSGTHTETAAHYLEISNFCRLLPIDRILGLGEADIIYDDPGWLYVPRDMLVWILPLAVILRPSDGAGQICAVDLWRRNPKAEVHGIVVIPSKVHRGPGYQRVGYFRVRQLETVEEIIKTIDRSTPKEFITLW
ncbi:hypothetical protein QBC34DRAFT_443353 [Podospora aff. communis PSN243]|uniref:Heterokaryon incompatibility domain-containing protein n=1 Tax=Podospora aff. communis PSN243 TaxID=3040156 RepID=A0AAV9G6P3_9PEZI|nr:hypothetical protein QBC34DRAFT_443353 [Podospora aff. communis PSN243]